MIIEFELQGSYLLHKGIFDTTGFWLKYEDLFEDIEKPGGLGINGVVIERMLTGYKLYSHFSFCFSHEEKKVCDEVYAVLCGCLRGNQGRDIPGIGYIRKLNK